MRTHGLRGPMAPGVGIQLVLPDPAPLRGGNPRGRERVPHPQVVEDAAPGRGPNELRNSGPVAEFSRSDRLVVPPELSCSPLTLAGMSFAIALSDEQSELVADLFDPPCRRGAPAVIPRRQMVDAMLFIGRTRLPVAALAR